jgi:stage V sporulation protein SpoVS
MVSSILAPSTAAGNSSEVTVAAGSTNTLAMYQGSAVDNFILPTGDNFLLPGGVDLLLMPAQFGIQLSKNDWGAIQLKDPDGEFFDSGMSLRHNGRFKTVGPGVWRIRKPATSEEVGFQSE